MDKFWDVALVDIGSALASAMRPHCGLQIPTSARFDEDNLLGAMHIGMGMVSLLGRIPQAFKAAGRANPESKGT